MDLAADGGGNCELSQPGETVSVGGVTIVAPLNLPATMPFRREPAVLPESHRLRPGVHQGQGVPARLQRRHPAGRAHHARWRGEARADARGLAKEAT